jgi:hypothetical protein
VALSFFACFSAFALSSLSCLSSFSFRFFSVSLSLPAVLLSFLTSLVLGSGSLVDPLFFDEELEGVECAFDFLPIDDVHYEHD